MGIKFKSFIIIWLLIITGLVMSILLVYTRHRAPFFQRIEMIEKKRRDLIHKQLNLTPEQEKKLEALRKIHENQREDFFKNIETKREELKNELESQELNKEKINQLHSELKAILCQGEDYRLNEILEVRTILSPEQYKKFIKVIGPPGPGHGHPPGSRPESLF